MNILLYGPFQHTATDGFIVEGVRHLLRRAFPTHEETFLLYADSYIIGPLPDKKIDIIVISGTPWLWDSFQNSIKYKNLLTILEKYPTAKKIFLGIGSCLDINVMYSDIMRRPAEVAAMQQIFKDALVITRDQVAKDILDFSKIDSTILPCPAHYAVVPSFEKSAYNLFIWANPLQTISNGYWQRHPTELATLMSNIEEYIKIKNPRIIKAFDWELPIEGQNIYTIPAWQNVIEEIARADQVISMRVHCAVPALAMGKKVGVVPIDSRAYTATYSGATLVNTLEDFLNPAALTVHLNEYEKQYVSQLRNFIGDVWTI